MRALIVVIAATAASPAFAAFPKAHVDYTYKRPEGLAAKTPASLALALPAGKLDAPAAEARAHRFAEALGVKLTTEKTNMAREPHGETVRWMDGRHHLKVYVPSGMLRWEDLSLHDRDLPDEAKLPAPEPARALELARGACKKLEAAKLLDPAQLAWPLARVSYRKEADERSAKQGEKLDPAMKPAVERVADVRVFVPRVLGGIPVSGHGVELVFTKSGKLTAAELRWRDVKLGPTALPVKLTMENARQRFEQELHAPPAGRVNVKVNELVYFDPSRREPVEFLEPAWLFEYQVEVPLADGKVAVSKVGHFTVPAIEHGRVQPPSARRERLKAVRAKMQSPKP